MLDLRVNLVEPRLGLLITTVGGYWATLGASGVLLVGMVMMTTTYGSGPGSTWLWVIPIVVFGLAVGPAVALTKRKGRAGLRNLRSLPRAITAASGWALMVAGFAAFMWVVMTL